MSSWPSVATATRKGVRSSVERCCRVDIDVQGHAVHVLRQVDTDRVQPGVENSYPVNISARSVKTSYDTIR